MYDAPCSMSKGTESRSEFTRKVIEIIAAIPHGRVTSYGAVAAAAGNPRAARGVVWVLNSSSKGEGLPWHRVINREGRISLKPGQGYELQKKLLIDEGVTFDANDNIDLKKFLWSKDQ